MFEKTQENKNAVSMKDKLKVMEAGIKTAFKEARFEDVKKMAAEIKTLDPANRLPDTLLAKLADAKVKAEIKAKEERSKEYQVMLEKLLKEGNFVNLRKLAAELKQFNPADKTAEKWLKQADDAELKAKIKQNKAKIDALEDQIKSAFKENNFVMVKQASEKMAEVDPSNSVMKKYMEKVQKAQAQPEAKDAGHESFLTKLFGKKEETKEVKKSAQATPAVEKTNPAPVAKAEAKPLDAKPAEVKTAAPAAKAEAKLEKEGNVFTRMFAQEEEAIPASLNKSIIDNIVEKTAEKKADARIERSVALQAEQEQKIREKMEGHTLLVASRTFVKFSMAFIVISAAFFYVENMDVNNRILGFFNVESNYASRLHAAAAELDTRKEQERELNKDINLYGDGYNNRYESIVKGIVDTRLNWPDILAKINEITDSVYERNAISQYIQYTGFSFDAETGEIRVTGTLSDPLGKNLTKLAELEEAFKYYPKDKNDPNDKTAPYFYQFNDFQSFSKSYDSKENKYTSNFQLSFSLTEAKPE